MIERRQSDVEIALLRANMASMQISMEKLEAQVAGLLEAWNTATGLVKFIKWMAALVTAVAVLVVTFKDHIR